MENDTHSFVVRIWHEAVDQDGKPAAWRGYIDHIASGTRFYFYDLNGITYFIEQQLGLKSKSLSKWQSLLAKIKHETS